MAEQELEIIGKFEFDKRDLVSVAVAKAERKIRGVLKIGTEVLKATEKALKEKREELDKLSQILPDRIKKLIAHYKKYIGPLLPGTTKLVCNGQLRKTKHGEEQQNEYIVIVKTHSPDSGHLTQNLPPIRMPLTKDQKLTIKQIESLSKEVRTAENDLIDAKRKLNDMPTFERQVKAAVVEAQLKGSATGKKLLKIMEADFEKTLKLLG